MIRKVTIEIISILLVLLFVYASVSKIIDYENFKIQLGKSPMLTQLASIVAVVVPTIELFIAALLVSGKTRKIGLFLSLALLVLFTAYLVAILHFSYYIPCSCGGILQGLSWQSHIIFNSLFIMATITAILLISKNNQSPGKGLSYIKKIGQYQE